MKKKYKTIGILGGMGPEATASLYQRIIRIFQKQYGAVYDDDFPEIIIINLPIPDVVENPTQSDKVQEMMIDGIKRLESIGVELIAIPCNTVAYYIPVLSLITDLPIINMVDETINTIKNDNIERVGILGTEMTITKGIYKEICSISTSSKILKPNIEEIDMVTKIIMNVLAGKKEQRDKELLLDLIERLKRRGAQRVILGCTELPLLIKKNKDTYNTLEILAKAVVSASTKER